MFISEIIATVQQTDLQQEEERLKHERAQREALRAKARPGTYNTAQLLAKMVGDAPEEAAPSDSPKPQEKAPDVSSRFPAPPLTGK